MTQTAAKAKRPLYKSFLFWSLSLFIFILIAAGVAFFLAKQTPDWYRPFDPRDKDVQLTAMRFHDVDSKLQARMLDAVAPGKPVTITFGEDVINSSLVVSTTSKPNDRVESPVMLFQNGRITFAARVKKLPIIGEGVLNFSLHFVLSPSENPQTDPATRITVIFDSVSVGNLPIPRSVLLDRIPELAPAIDNAIKLEGLEKRARGGEDRAEQIRDFLKNLAAEKPTPVPYLYPGGRDGKTIRPIYLHAITVADHNLSLTFAAEPLGLNATQQVQK